MAASRTRRAGAHGASIRRLYRQILSIPAAQGVGTQSRPNSDPGMQSGLSSQGLHDAATVAFGVVTDVTAIANCYRVQLDKLHYPITATLAGPGSTAAFGARPLNTIQPGSQVVVVWHPATYYGVIIGVIPFAQTDGSKTIHEQLAHTTRNRVDEGHKRPLKLGGKGFVTDWLSGRPFDATNVGEGGWITETGMRIFIDPFMAMIGLDEATSLTAFYADQLLRIAAYNLRMFTAGFEREGINDGCEYNDWTGFTPYPWEQLGLFERGDSHVEYTPQSWQLDEPWNGPWEPRDPDARSWHRLTLYRGYIGQGGKQTICTRPTTGTVAKFAPEQPVYPCLLDQTTTLDGRYILGSAKGIHIVKRAGLIAPQRKYVPEQIKNEGDNADSYKFAGLAGNGPDHAIEHGLSVRGDPTELVRASAIQDLHAYLFNYVSLHGMYWHEKDWDCPEQSKLDHISGKYLEVPSFDELTQSMFLKAPEPSEVKIDSRYPNTQLYRNEAGISVLDDGGIVIYDGFGGEIRMTGGSIFISAPGDVWLKPGRTANVWGGDDVIIRAKNSLDMSTSEKDIRIKAERNLQTLSGNSGAGGTLIECRGQRRYDFHEKVGEDVESGSVMLRSLQSDVVAWADTIYMRTGGGTSGGSGGPIVLDANRGTQPLITHASVHQHYIDQQFFIHYGRDGDVRKSLTFSEGGSAIPSQLFVDGGGVFGGKLLCSGGLLVSGGHVATTGGSPFVGELKDAGPINAAIESGRVSVSSTFPQDVGVAYYTSVLEPLIYDEHMAGNDTVIDQAEFSFRNVAQYGTEEFALFEDRWQQQSRIAERTWNKWYETPVTTQYDSPTYPYPGRENFQEDTLMQLDLQLVDLVAGRDRDRGESPNLQDTYAKPSTNETRGVSLHDYLVIR